MLGRKFLKLDVSVERVNYANSRQLELFLGEESVTTIKIFTRIFTFLRSIKNYRDFILVRLPQARMVGKQNEILSVAFFKPSF